MRTYYRPLLALALALLCLPAFAANCPSIKTFNANDTQTGEPVTLSWSYAGGAPQTQTLTGHDFAQPLVLPAGQTSYTYTPLMPGEKHAQLTAVSGCGTSTSQIKYHVKQCNVVAPVLTVSQTSVKPGDVLTASIDLLPGHNARWVVTNGIASSQTGASVQITAATAGTLVIDVYVKRGNGNSCEVKSSATVEVVAPCSITEPSPIVTPDSAAPNEQYFLFVPNIPAGQTITFEVRGAQIVFSNGQAVLVMTPATGSFEIDVIVSNGTCTRRFTRTATVTACAPTATVRAGSGGSCGSGTVVADFTGTAPFQGYWTDGEYFFTSDSHIARTVTNGGTYSINFFRDRFCNGTVTGSATVEASLPTPTFTISDVANGYYYGNATCPGLPRTATLDAPIPAGLQVLWNVTNATILGGQGTATLQFAGNQPGQTTLTAVYRNASGCTSQPHTYPYITTQGAPEATMTVEPATIRPGETAVITITPKYFGGFNLTSSLGDVIGMISSNGDGSSRWEYRSSHGGGLATINLDAQNYCGQSVHVSTTLTIEGGPVAATANVRASGSTCPNYIAVAEFTGLAPFSGTWSDGSSFTIDYPNAILRPPTGGTYTLTSFSDANGPGTITGSATFDFVRVPAPDFTFDTAAACPGSTITARLTAPLAPGTSAEWYAYPGEILSGQGTDTITIRAGDGGLNVQVQISGSACSIDQTYKFLPVGSTTPQPPQFDVYGVDTGGTTSIFVWLDPSTATWAFENSLGDPMAITENPYPNAYILSYTSTHGAGTSNVRIYGTTSCGNPFEATRTMQILPPMPTATLTSTQGDSCGANITVTFTGTAPFTGTWNDGTPFTSSDMTLTRFVTDSGYYYLNTIRDANRDGYGTGTYVDVKYLPYVSFRQDGGFACAGRTMKFIVDDVPAGYGVRWTIEGTNATIVSGQGTGEVTLSLTEAGRFLIGAVYESPEGCVGLGSGYFVDVAGAAVSPVITLPATTLKVGESMDFTIAFDGNQFSNGFTALSWENSNGDPIYSVGQTGYTFNLRYEALTVGTSTIRAYATTACGDNVEATATVEIVP